LPTTAHIPALRALPSYEIRALSAHNANSAPAGELFGVGAVFSDYEQLLTQPDIDVVAITVKVHTVESSSPPALDAGKAVYCEWPLVRDLDDSRAMAALAPSRERLPSSGCRPAKRGRSSSSSSAPRRIRWRGLVNNHGGAVGPRQRRGPAQRLHARQDTGANLLTIAIGHSLDTLNCVLGEFTDLSALSDLRRPLITIEETGEQIVKTAADQIAIIGTLT
jgi:hypothetical protein